jgi:hypothetical protein
MRALVVLMLLSAGCAAVLRPSSRSVTIWGPEDLRILDNGRDLPVTRGEQRGDRREYEISVDKSARAVTAEAHGVQVPLMLSTHVSTGWLVVDVLFGLWPALVDALAGQLTSFEEADAVTPIRATLAARGGAPNAQVATAPAPAPVPVRAPAPVPVPVTLPALAVPTVLVTSGKLAVLDFKSFTDALKPEDVRYFTDVVRGEVLRRAPGVQVMTRENLLVLLQATGKDMASCEGECEVDTGRRIGADMVISGEVLKVGTHFKLSLKLHETHDGRLLSTAVGSGKTIDELDDSAQTAAGELIVPK